MIFVDANKTNNILYLKNVNHYYEKMIFDNVLWKGKSIRRY